MGALRDLPLPRLLGQDQPLAPRPLELVVAAGVERELATLQMTGLLGTEFRKSRSWLTRISVRG